MAFQSLKLLTKSSKRMRLYCCSHHLDYMQKCDMTIPGTANKNPVYFWNHTLTDILKK